MSFLKKVFLSAFLFPIAVYATVPLEGYFIAKDNCPATSSIKKGTNPDNLALSKNRMYKVVGKNKLNETHYLIEIGEDKPAQRWVEASCGKLLTDCKQKSGAKPDTSTKQDYLLAISWQPAFCETHQQKAECASQTSDRYDATHLSLHGLWPQPESNAYCNVSNKDKTFDKQGQWNLLPAVELTESTLENLAVSMPGIASHLERHEWIKHGTCYGDSAETYYKHALSLISQLNESSIRDLISENIGKTVTAEAIRAKFNESFGKNAGDKVNVKCNNKGMITELRINLQGKIEDNTTLDVLLKDAPSVKTDCKTGLVDAAGFAN
jgi:ribonuclease T2